MFSKEADAQTCSTACIDNWSECATDFDFCRECIEGYCLYNDYDTNTYTWSQENWDIIANARSVYKDFGNSYINHWAEGHYKNNNQ